MSAERVLRDIPEDELEEVIGDFESEGCTVTKKKQPDEKWTVIATCPDPEEE